MYKVVFAAVMDLSLIAAALPAFSQSTAAPAEPAKSEMKKEAEPKKAPSAGMVEKGQNWPQFWSACNKRLKGAR